MILNFHAYKSLIWSPSEEKTHINITENNKFKRFIIGSKIRQCTIEDWQISVFYKGLELPQGGSAIHKDTLSRLTVKSIVFSAWILLSVFRNKCSFLVSFKILRVVRLEDKWHTLPCKEAPKCVQYETRRGTRCW